MDMMAASPEEFILSARVPTTIVDQEFGGWTIRRCRMPPLGMPEKWKHLGLKDYTVLHRTSPVFKEPTWEDIHLEADNGMVPKLDIVMEDSPRELATHLPCWLGARGRVLITGLGLGCVLRGLLASPVVEHVDVVEIDPEIIRVIGPEFYGNPRCSIHCCDAREFPSTGHWDFAWHDIWTPENVGLQVEHARLMMRFRRNCDAQGAWSFPRPFKRKLRDAKRFHCVG